MFVAASVNTLIAEHAFVYLYEFVRTHHNTFSSELAFTVTLVLEESYKKINDSHRSS